MLAEAFDNKAFHPAEIKQSKYRSSSLIEVKLYFEPHVAYRVYDEFDEQYITENDDGSFIVTIMLPNDYWLYDYIFSFGAAVEVIEPQNVRDEIVRQKIKNILPKHDALSSYIWYTQNIATQ